MKRMSSEVLRDFMLLIDRASQEYTSRVRDTLTTMQAAAQADGAVPDSALGELCAAARRLSLEAHRLKYFYDWLIEPSPEWHDHFVDQHFQFAHDRVSFWLERGVYNVLALKPASAILELCCGDGFNAYHFYSPFARRLVALDFDHQALDHARRHNSAPNIEFRHADIRTGLPDGLFDNIVWDAAIEHFTETEIESLIRRIKERLAPAGILSGYTVVEKGDGQKHIEQHEREFQSKEDLAQLLTPFFSNVRVFETVHPTRHNLYFYCSEDVLPFDEAWPAGLSIRQRA
jgi:cyclopropane fatty-acyl-phospholipid synthase-like methyltransferase